jgi:hypothetical protein
MSSEDHKMDNIAHMLFDDTSVSCFLFVHLLLELVKKDSTILDGNCAVYELLLMTTQ